MRKKLFLFDIDGTLVSPGSVSRKILNNVMTDLLGVSPDLQFEDVAGNTDQLIVKTGLKRVGVNEEEINNWIKKILKEYADRLPNIFNESKEPFAYEDAQKLLKQVLENKFSVGVLSGNIKAAAEVKLKRFGLLDHFPFGVYGADTDDRSAMPIIARERAWDAYNEAFRFEDMVLVGDTAADARAAADNGCKSIIVCRREKTNEQAMDADATLIVSSLDKVDI